MTFIVNLFNVPRVSWRNLRILLQILDQSGNFGVVEPFLVNGLKPICENDRVGKEGPLFFIFP
jgi:hypothetical protein